MDRKEIEQTTAKLEQLMILLARYKIYEPLRAIGTLVGKGTEMSRNYSNMVQQEGGRELTEAFKELSNNYFYQYHELYKTIE